MSVKNSFLVLVIWFHWGPQIFTEKAYLRIFHVFGRHIESWMLSLLSSTSPDKENLQNPAQQHQLPVDFNTEKFPIFSCIKEIQMMMLIGFSLSFGLTLTLTLSDLAFDSSR